MAKYGDEKYEVEWLVDVSEKEPLGIFNSKPFDTIEAARNYIAKNRNVKFIKNSFACWGCVAIDHYIYDSIWNCENRWLIYEDMSIENDWR